MLADRISALRRLSTDIGIRPSQWHPPKPDGSLVSFALPTPKEYDDGPAATTRTLYDPTTNADVVSALFRVLEKDPRLGPQLPVITFLKKHMALLDDINALIPTLKDFELIGTIGDGFHGTVELVEEMSTGDHFALKSICKRSIIANPSATQYMIERDIMVAAHSQWLARAHAAFHDDERLYLAMEYFPRGDLYNHLSESGDVFDEDTARFYLAEMAEALHTLHKMGFMHRDVKPDNFVIDEAGHLALTDFGCAARIADLTQASGLAKAVGTPDYISPEVLNHALSVGAPTYGLSADWWSFGVTAYEMLYGEMPFSDECEAVTLNNIMNFETMLALYEEAGATIVANDLLRNLLCAPGKRFGYEQIKAHPFFAGVNWGELRSQRPPSLPTEVAVGPPPRQRYSLSSELPRCTELQQLQFAGYSYTPPETMPIPTSERRGSLAAGLKLELDAVKDAKRASSIALSRQLRAADDRISFLERKVEALQTNDVPQDVSRLSPPESASTPGAESDAGRDELPLGMSTAAAGSPYKAGDSSAMMSAQVNETLDFSIGVMLDFVDTTMDDLNDTMASDVAAVGSPARNDTDLCLLDRLGRPRRKRPSVFNVFGERVVLEPLLEEMSQASGSPARGATTEASEKPSPICNQTCNQTALPSSRDNYGDDGRHAEREHKELEDNDSDDDEGAAPFDCEGVRFGTVSRLIKVHSSAGSETSQEPGPAGRAMVSLKKGSCAADCNKDGDPTGAKDGKDDDVCVDTDVDDDDDADDDCDDYNDDSADPGAHGGAAARRRFAEAVIERLKATMTS
mmetsp:Transcript_9372/g.28353  ORF Transcript_9372/g.28353 Transcript_9372/m.28353 type:complete len:801 (-) Transcript_9372:138-2540(-)